MRKLTLTLGGEEHEIAQLRTREAAGWRKKFDEPLAALVDAINQGMLLADRDAGSDQVRGVMAQIGKTALGLTDQIVALMEGYSEELSKALDEAYDDEVVDAFVALVRAHFPFERFAPAMRELFGNGFLSNLTAPSSPSASGGSGTTS